MHLLSILALAEHTSCSAFDQMLRFFGIAAIVYAFFKGIHLLTSKTATPQAQPAAPLAASPTPPPAAACTGSEDIAPETIAVIAAAVISATGSFRRIVSIKSQSALWEKAGRQSVLTSHKIR